MKIRLKVLLLIFAVVLLAGGAAAVIGRSIALSIVEDEISDHLVTTAQSRAQHIQTVLQHRVDNIELFAEQIRLILYGGTQSVEEDLPTFAFVSAGVVNATDDLDAAIFLDEYGVVVVSSDLDRFPYGMDLSTSEVFVQGQRGTYLGSFDIAESEGQFVLCAAAPLALNKDESRIGTLVMLGGEGGLFEIATDATGLGETGEVYLVNENGYMITPSRFVEDAVLNQTVDLLEASEAASIAAGAGSAETEWRVVASRNYQDSRVLGVYHPLPEVGWTLVVEKGSTEAFAPVSRLTRTTLWVLLGVLVLGGVLALLLSRTISRPIIKLHRGTEEIMAGNWDYDVSTPAKDEIGELSRAFGEMTANLRKSHEELRHYSESLEEQVKQKDVLLKEIHHRVKNNLQVISSLLNLQAARVSDEEVHEVLRDSQNRVRSMALVHESLYRSKDLARVDFAEYMRSLTAQLFRTYRGNGAGASLKLDVQDVSLGIDVAVPCGLIVNELLTNSLKYAFPNGTGGGRSGEIRVGLSSDDDHDFTLIVADNGIGLPEGMDFRRTESLGLQLVCTLTQQLRGEIEANGTGGTEFKITFPISDAGKRG